MQAIVCEMCGSNDIVKQDGLFVCQNCGTKYTLEEARKLMGTVKIDETEKFDNIYQLAQRAKETSNIQDAKKYYGMLREQYPNHWEFYFFSIYYDAWDSKVGQIPIVTANVKNALQPTFNLIDNSGMEYPFIVSAHFDVASNVESMAIAFNNTIMNQHKDNVNRSRSNNNFELIKSSSVDFADRSAAIGQMLLRLALCLDTEYRKDTTQIKYKETFLRFLKYQENTLVDFYNSLYGTFKIQAYSATHDVIESYTKVIKDYEPDHTNPLDNMIQPIPQKSGCYVATAVYGSYDCPEVWTLRRFRDYTLLRTWYGRIFVKTYYAISPTLVKWFGNTIWFKKLWRKPLDKMVNNLNKSGFKDTPYYD